MPYDVGSTPMAAKPLIISQIDEMASRVNHLAENVKALEDRLAKVSHAQAPTNAKAGEMSKALDIDLGNQLLAILNRMDNLIEITQSLLSRLEI